MSAARTVVNPGDRFGKWTVLHEVKSKTRHRRVFCECECGTTRAVLLQSLVSEQSRSCGCTGSGAKWAGRALYRSLWESEKKEIRKRKNAA